MVTTVLAPVATYGGMKAGVRFTAGVGHTDNPGSLAYFARAGYTIEPEPVIEIVPDAYDGLTKKQLVALAAERGVAVNPKSSNAVIRDALIDAALVEEDESTDPEPDAPSMVTDPELDAFAPGTEG